MLTFLIGHRGSGKSSLLKRIETYYREIGLECICIDLDTKIAEAEGTTIDEIFAKRGEAQFRQLEIKFSQVLAQKYGNATQPIFVALGAGFMGEIPKAARCLWVRRPTDSAGRIFFDRPRLDSSKSAMQEYLDRYKERQNRYLAIATEEITIAEGFNRPNEHEKAFFTGALDCGGATLTVAPEVFRDFDGWLWRRMKFNLRFELRDDLLSADMLKMAIDKIPAEKIILSLRTSPRQKSLLSALKRESLWDWPLEWELPARIKPPIFSLHERKDRSVLAAGERLVRASKQAILKLAVEVRDFDELLEGHEWALQDPERRSFLPRSFDGRWSWYRLLAKGRSPIAFVREGEGSSIDQPYILDWARAPVSPASFAAILGDPVLHSLTPAEQFDYFSSKKLPVLAIPMSESDWEHGAFEVVKKIGLRAAAVTSPLKLRASKVSAEKTEEAKRFDSVNTLARPEGKEWIGHNTDFAGLKKLFESAGISGWKGVAVWGGGGTLPLLESLLPEADFYSARTGENRRKKPATPPQTLIWGVGASRAAKTTFPPPEWKPSIVIDLNYSEDSPGREYAVKVGAKYLSGIEMFRAQAAGQRAFWKSLWDTNG